MKFGVSLPVRELADDLIAIRDFAQLAEGLGLTHLRVPEQIIRPDSGHLHESMMILAYIAAITEKIELVPSVVILPARQTALFAKQAAELDVLSGGRLRLGIGVGGSKEEYQALDVNFTTRGRRCDEQMQLLKRLWAEETVDFEGEFDTIQGVGLNPLPVQRPIPMWIGARGTPAQSVIRRIGQLSNGWFVLCSPEEFPDVRDSIFAEAEAAGRSSDELGQEAGVAVVGPRQTEWKDRVIGW
ncbi:MAG: TIGR03619 family F420-dependent LLM class oxidoreductase, partial [Gammaproteobacteria bacterium]|nr:TIGR03619 family F420-dependent LLM class oxidoreductase [Gammaproteobacteria bacterium]